MEKKHINISIFVPHNGCPNDCSFCNQRKITGQTEKMTPEKAEKIIKEHLNTIEREKTNIEIAFFGGSFTGIPKDEQEALLKIAKAYKDKHLIDGIRLSTRPDYIDEDILSFLKLYGVTAIELGAQSMNDDVLSLNDRGHTKEDTKRASNLIKKYGFELGLQMMVGLYSDTSSGAIETAREISKLKPKCVRVYPTLVLKDTKLARLFLKGEYKPLEVFEAVETCAKILEVFEKENIKVLRVGLLRSDNINDKNDVLAGPFHPSFGELAASELVFLKLVSNLPEGKDEIKISVNPRFVSIAVGNKKRNITRLKENYNIKNVSILQDETINYGDFTIK